MDYDYWLQKSAGCFDEYYEASNDDVFEWYSNTYGDVPVKQALDDYGIPYCVVEAIVDRMWEDENVLKDLEAGVVDDLQEWLDKHPGQYEILYEKYKPKNARELYNLVGREGWDSLEEEFYEYYNDREDLSYEYNYDY